MSGDKITNLTAATVVDESNDAVVVVDTSDTTQASSGTTKKVTPKILRGGKDLPTGDFVGTTDTQILTNKTLTSPKLNEDVAITSTATEVNVLDGITASTAELNKTDGVAGDIVGTSDTQTLTNKTLTNPTINFTNKAVTQNVLCRAYLGTSMTNLTSGTFTKILLDTESYDVGSDFNTTTNTFTVPVTGYYDIFGNIRYSSLTADKFCMALIYVDGSEAGKRYESNGSDSNGIQDVSIIDKMYLTSGQTVSLYGRVLTGTNTVDVDAGSGNTMMCISLFSI